MRLGPSGSGWDQWSSRWTSRSPSKPFNRCRKSVVGAIAARDMSLLVSSESISSVDSMALRRRGARIPTSLDPSSTMCTVCVSPPIQTATEWWSSGLRGVLIRIRALSILLSSSTSSSTSMRSLTAATNFQRFSTSQTSRGMPQHWTHTSLWPGLIVGFHFWSE